MESSNSPRPDSVTHMSRTSSFSSIIDVILPSMKPTKALWRKPLLHRDVSIDCGDMESKVNPHRSESWYELFYDLVFVAAAIQIGNIIKYDISVAGLAKSGLLFGVMRSTWDLLMAYQNKYDTKDMIHYVYYLLQAMFAFVMCLHLTLDHDHNWDADRNLIPFSVAAACARFSDMCMYAQVVWLSKSYRTHMMALMMSQGLSAIVFVLASWAPRREDSYWIYWLVALLIERLFVHVFVYLCLRKEKKKRAPEHIEHFSHRHGVFIMLILGEAIIQLVQSEPKETFTDYLRGLMGFAVIFNVGDVYYQQQIVSLYAHRETKRFPNTRIWIILHMFLSVFMMYFAVGIKLVYSEHDKGSRNLKHEYLMCISCAAALATIFLLRMTHKGVFNKGKQNRLLSYSYRYVLCAMCACVPLVTANATITISTLFIISSFLVMQGLFSHRGRRSSSASEHAPHLYHSKSVDALADIPSSPQQQLGYTRNKRLDILSSVLNASGHLNSLHDTSYDDSSFGRDAFVKKRSMSEAPPDSYRASSYDAPSAEYAEMKSAVDSKV